MKANRIPFPPSLTASGTGGYAINTADNPPNAAKPITPALKIPAYPN